MASFANPQAALGYVTDQTYRINAEVIRMEYPETNIDDLVQVETAGDPWANGVISYTMDGVGQARWHNGGSNTVPLADVLRGRVDIRFELGALGYEFNLEEVNKARQIGQNLPDDRAYYARQGAEQFIYYTGITGDPLTGMKGLINNSAITQGTVLANGNQNGATNSPLWINKTADQVLADVNNLIVAPYNASNQILMADTLLLPFTAMQVLDLRVLPNTSETLATFIARSNSYTRRTGLPLRMRALRELETAGSGGTRRMIAYSRNTRVVKFHMPKPFEFLPIWQNGPMNWLVAGIFRVGGTDWTRPASATYADGF